MKAKERPFTDLWKFKRNNPAIYMYTVLCVVTYLVMYLIYSFVTLSWNGLVENILESKESRIWTLILLAVQQVATYLVASGYKRKING